MEPIEIGSASGSKQAIHFGTEGRPLFGFYHPPREGPWRGVGVVLCRPIGTDQTRSDRAYRHLAERLAASGFACLRFDLFGTGDSGGDEFAPGLVKTWLDDVGLAIDELRAVPELRSHPGQKFLITISHRASLPDEVLDSIVGWLKEVYPSSVPEQSPPPRSSAPAPMGERPIRFGERNPLFGIFTPANP